jgi:hypothetical protein
MEGIIDLLGQCAADPRNLAQILNTGPGHFLYATELLQKPLATSRTDTGNALQR